MSSLTPVLDATSLRQILLQLDHDQLTQYSSTLSSEEDKDLCSSILDDLSFWKEYYAKHNQFQLQDLTLGQLCQEYINVDKYRQADYYISWLQINSLTTPKGERLTFFELQKMNQKIFEHYSEIDSDAVRNFFKSWKEYLVEFPNPMYSINVICRLNRDMGEKYLFAIVFDDPHSNVRSSFYLKYQTVRDLLRIFYQWKLIFRSKLGGEQITVPQFN